MKLHDWIQREKLTVADAARQLGITGVNPGRTLARLLSGEREAGTEIVFRIITLTKREVTVQDMFETRLAWLRINKPGRVFEDEHIEAAE